FWTIVQNIKLSNFPSLIYEDFIVVKYSKPMLIFSNPLLKKYKCVINWDKDELKISHNGKDLIIPVTMHKVKNKLKNLQDLIENSNILKKTHEL
ncbi:17451_t:CDS:2, partial [Funneliformis caledonium]